MLNKKGHASPSRTNAETATERTMQITGTPTGLPKGQWLTQKKREGLPALRVLVRAAREDYVWPMSWRRSPTTKGTDQGAHRDLYQNNHPGGGTERGDELSPPTDLSRSLLRCGSLIAAVFTFQKRVSQPRLPLHKLDHIPPAKWATASGTSRNCGSAKSAARRSRSTSQFTL
jgi:hypothetical protein